MIRSLILAICLAAPAMVMAAPDNPSKAPANNAPAPISGVVADPSGAIIPGAQIDLMDASGAVAGTFHSGDDGSFRIQPPKAGSYTLVISGQGFETMKMPVVVAPVSAVAAPTSTHPFVPASPLRITLPIAALSTSVHVSAENSEDLTSTEDNHDSSVMTSSDLKQLPIFDDDYAGAMSAFMDDSASATGGAGMLVDGVESGRSTVSASAVQEVRINQDPYSAQYYWPGRGQMEIITKSAADHYHGQANFYYRNSAMNAQNALAPNKPDENRQVYEGHITGPIFFAPNSGFLISASHSSETTNAVIDAVVPSTPDNPSGQLQQNVPTPHHDNFFSARASHKFGDKHSAYAQYSYYDSVSTNQGIGGQTLAEAAYNSTYHEDDVTLHADSTLSSEWINQLSIVGEHDQNRNTDVAEAPHVSVSGDFSGGSAQGDWYQTTYNFRVFDMASWMHGRHYLKAGIGIPNMARRAFDDRGNELGSYTYAATIAADGVTVTASALDNYTSHHPSAYSVNYGDVHYVIHFQEMGAFVQDQIKLSTRLSITPGIRYDWANVFAQKRLAFSPRASFAWVIDEKSKTVIRGGGGLYYDRTGMGPIQDLARYEGPSPRRRSVSLSLDPTTQPCGPMTDTNCVDDVNSLPVNLTEFQPNVKMPYQIQYGLSIERHLGDKATATVSAYSVRGISEFRSVDVNAPTPESGYTERPDADYLRIRQMQSAGFFAGNAMDISYEGRLNKWFTGFGRYTWSHWDANTGGIGWWPQNQYDPNNEWGPANWDRRNRLGFYGLFNPKSVFNLSGGVFANSGSPWTITTGADDYGTALFNARPEGVDRNSENLPPYVDVDMRWGHDWAFTSNKDDEAPRVGFSASAFNLLNHPSTGSVDSVQTSPDFEDTTSVSSPRRIQLAMRFEF